MSAGLLHLGSPPGRAAELDPLVIVVGCLVLVAVAAAIWAPAARQSLHGLIDALRATPSSEYVRRDHPSQIVRFISNVIARWTTASLLGVLVVAAGLVCYLTVRVPVRIAMLPSDQAHRYWPAALAAVFDVAVYDATMVFWAVRARTLAKEARRDARMEPRRTRPAAPPKLRFQLVPRRILAISGITSCAGLIAGAASGLPLWCIAVVTLLPWLPVALGEAAWKYKHYGLYAILLVVTALQVGHVGEHAAQVTQLLLTNGDLARSHGVFGQLDFETVHFVWDTGVWISIGLLCARFSTRRWLWVAFAAASVHEVEHVYLYWLVMAHHDFYMQGGLAGIFGRGGVVGSPLYRPYLHFLYNVAVTMPMLIAVLDETREIADAARMPAPTAKSHAPSRAYPRAATAGAPHAL